MGTQGSAGSPAAGACQLPVTTEFATLALADKPCKSQNAEERGGDVEPAFPVWKNAPTWLLLSRSDTDLLFQEQTAFGDFLNTANPSLVIWIKAASIAGAQQIFGAVC